MEVPEAIQLFRSTLVTADQNSGLGRKEEAIECLRDTARKILGAFPDAEIKDTETTEDAQT